MKTQCLAILVLIAAICGGAYYFYKTIPEKETYAIATQTIENYFGPLARVKALKIEGDSITGVVSVLNSEGKMEEQKFDAKILPSKNGVFSIYVSNPPAKKGE